MGNQTNATAQQAIAEQNAAQTASVESSNDAAQAVVFTEGQEKKFALQVVRVQLFDQDDIVNVSLTFNKSFPGFVKDKDGNFVATETNVISLSRSKLTKQLCDCDESFALLRDGQKDPLSRAQLATLLHGSVLTIARTYHVAGFVQEDRDPLVRDQWFTQIESMKMNEFSKNLIQQVIIQRMMKDDK